MLSIICFVGMRVRVVDVVLYHMILCSLSFTSPTDKVAEYRYLARIFVSAL
jgi:hypothetical protein